MATVKKSTKKTGAEGISGLRKLSDFEPREKVPTGITTVDRILEGGIPKGTITEVFGVEGGGKTCIATMLAGEAQKHGEVVYFDLENCFDSRKAINSGVNPEELLFGDPEDGEHMFSIIEEALGSPGVSLIIVDSVTAISTAAQIAGDYGDAQVAQLARLLSPALNNINTFMRKNNPDTILFFINQIREKVGGMGGFQAGPQTYTPGGRALKFYSSTRLKVARKENIKAGDTVVGQQVVVETVKARFAPQLQKATFDLYYEDGVSNESPVFDDAVKSGRLLVAGGGWVTDTVTGEKVGQGKIKVLSKMKEDREFYDSLVASTS